MLPSRLWSRTGFVSPTCLAVLALLLLLAAARAEGPGEDRDQPQVPEAYRGRLGANREKLALQGGGNKASEAAVAAGLLFLARHQSADGHWSLDQFQVSAHDLDRGADAPRFDSDCTGQGTKNDTAGTAFGLLPFLGAGVTHKAPRPEDDRKMHYEKVVEAGLDWLVKHQSRDGDLGGGMYAHALATIALCEAYGMTADPNLKAPAQQALDFIVKAQDPTLGGWRYVPRSGSDTSVTGFQVQALKSGEMAGLTVPTATFKGAEKWLDSCATADKGGYGYTGPQETPSMTAVGLLCRQYLGWSPKNAAFLSGVPRLQGVPPKAVNSIYYYYYATAVMHNLGGDDWQAWNSKMRDWLVETQDQGNDPKRPYQKGSWNPKPDIHGTVGGRIMVTSLSLLTLEVYYRHLPLEHRNPRNPDRPEKEDQ